MRSSLRLLILCAAFLAGPLSATFPAAFAQAPAPAVTGTAPAGSEVGAPAETPKRTGNREGRRGRGEGAGPRSRGEGAGPRNRAEGSGQRETTAPDDTRAKSEAPATGKSGSPSLQKAAAGPGPSEPGTPGSRPPADPQNGAPAAPAGSAAGVPNPGAGSPGENQPPAASENTPGAPGEAPGTSEGAGAAGAAGSAGVAAEEAGALPAGNSPTGNGRDAGETATAGAVGAEAGSPAGSNRTEGSASGARTTAPTGSATPRAGGSGRNTAAAAPKSGSQSGGGAAERSPAPAPLTARAVLATWRNLFERSPLGFDQTTPGQAYQDATTQLRQFSRQPHAALDGVTGAGWGLWLGLLALGLLLVGGAILERAQPERWRAFWKHAELRSERLPMGPWLVRLGHYVAVPLLILIVWSLGGLFAGTTSPGFILVQGLLAIWIAYRLLDRLLPAHLELKPVVAPDAGAAAGETAEGATEETTEAAGANGSTASTEATAEAAENAERLQRPFHRMLLFTAYWAAGWMTMEFLAYRPDVVALWVAAGHLVLVLMAASILLRKQLVLSLLPTYENPAYQRFLRVASALYKPLIYFSILVALLWVVGYRNLAAVFLARSWALVAIWLIGFGLFHTLYRLADRSIPPHPERAAEREQLLSSLHRLAAFVVLVFVYAFSLKVLDLWEPWLHLREQPWIEAGSLRVTGNGIWLSLLLGAFLLLVSRWLQSALSFHVYPRMGIGAGEAYALNRLLHYAIVAAIVLLVLNNLGLSPTSLALVAGGLSVGLGFGLQNIANNLASGLILLTSRQVRQGDLITVGDQTGIVREVNLRATTVTTGDNLDLLIPNSKLLEDTLINWTHGTSVVRSKVPFGVAYSADPTAVEEAALAVARAHPDVLPEPAPEVWFKNMGDNALEFDLLVWTDLRTSVRPRVTSQLLHQLFRAFGERDIEIPFPQRDLHLRSGIPWDRLIHAMSGNGKNGHAHEAPVAVAAPNGGTGASGASERPGTS